MEGFRPRKGTIVMALSTVVPHGGCSSLRRHCLCDKKCFCFATHGCPSLRFFVLVTTSLSLRCPFWTPFAVLLTSDEALMDMSCWFSSVIFLYVSVPAYFI